MGGEAGPTVSVSTSGFYITGKSTDTVSGTAGYCYNTADEPGEYTDADGSTSEYTAEQYHVQATGTYRFHAIDIAGNHKFDTTEEITFFTYHCNYCGQNTNDLTNHYRCPTHFASQTCSSFLSSCSVGSVVCGSRLKIKWIRTMTTSSKCYYCGNLTYEYYGYNCTNGHSWGSSYICSEACVTNILTYDPWARNWTCDKKLGGCGLVYDTNYNTN